MQIAPDALEGRDPARRLNGETPQLSQKNWPPVAVCILGSCLESELYGASADAVLRQDYPGHVTLIVPEGASFDQTSIRRRRSVTLVQRTAARFELAYNSAFEAALALFPAAEFVAVLSSGETAPSQWLRSLVQAQEDFDADLVMGSLKARFNEPPPDWMLAGGFFDRCGNRRGPIARMSARDNLLIRASVLTRLLPRMGVSRGAGQEDEWAEFEQCIKALRLTSVWANDAVVFDCVPASRMNTEWLIEREYRKGLSMARIRSVRRTHQVTIAGRSRPAIALALSMADLVSRGLACIDRAYSVQTRLMLARARGHMAGATSGDAPEEGTA